MRSKRIEIVEAENGYTVTVWDPENKEEGRGSDFGYSEPVNFVAKDVEEVLTLVKENC